MQALAIVLVIKIAFTIALWTTPLLFFRKEFLQRLGFPVHDPMIFFRLFGMATLSLTLGYSLGLRSVLSECYPSTTIWVGILSNGGSFFILLLGALNSSWAQWGRPAKWVMWISLVATGAITVGLTAFGPLMHPELLQSGCR